MPSIDQLSNVDVSGYTRMAQSPIPPAQHPENLLVQRSADQVCSLPYLPGTFPSTDSITGFGLAGKIPQWRAPLPAISNSGSGTTTNTSTVVSSSSSTTTNNPPVAQTASIAVPSLNPGQTFVGTVLMAKSFLLQTVSASAPVRVELYATAAARSSDSARLSTVPPGYGNEQGLIADLSFPTAPIVWLGCPAIIGFNADAPQTNVIYVTITNLGVGSETPSISMTYVPMQS